MLRPAKAGLVQISLSNLVEFLVWKDSAAAKADATRPFMARATFAVMDGVTGEVERDVNGQPTLVYVATVLGFPLSDVSLALRGLMEAARAKSALVPES